jgi:hypothetical protein
MSKQHCHRPTQTIPIPTPMCFPPLFDPLGTPAATGQREQGLERLASAGTSHTG